jgi:hypothetical protein
MTGSRAQSRFIFRAQQGSGLTHPLGCEPVSLIREPDPLRCAAGAPFFEANTPRNRGAGA